MGVEEVSSFTTINYKRHRMIQRSSHSLQGLSLLRNCLDELPQDRKATIAGDMGELKRELREKVILLLVVEMMIIMTMRRWKITWFWKARRESELAKSKMQPNSAHKVTHEDWHQNIKLDFLGLCLAWPTWRSRDGIIKSFCISLSTPWKSFSCSWVQSTAARLPHQNSSCQRTHSAGQKNSNSLD